MNKLKPADAKSQVIHDVEFDRYFKASDWSEYNRCFFDQLAPKYDFLNQISSCGCHDGFKRRAVARIPVFPGAKVLDLCTGSGDIAIALASACPDIHVEAVDASARMLYLAQVKARKRGVAEKISFRQGDVMRLNYPDNHFDVTVISFGLRNLIDLPAAVKEFHRLTRPGGAFVNIDLGKPQGLFRKVLYEIYFRRILPFLGKHIFHRGEFNSFKYLPVSNEFFPSPQELVGLYLKAGFDQPRVYEYMLGGVSQQILWKL